MIKTEGKVISVKEDWWLKVNTKPVRKGAFDGAVFPHTITVEYEVEGITYTKKKFVWIDRICPNVGSKVTLEYPEGKPKKAKVIL